MMVSVYKGKLSSCPIFSAKLNGMGYFLLKKNSTLARLSFLAHRSTRLPIVWLDTPILPNFCKHKPVWSTGFVNAKYSKHSTHNKRSKISPVSSVDLH